MRDEDFVRQGHGKVQCMWKVGLFCTLMMQCVYACDCHCYWCVCVSRSPLRCCQCLGKRHVFYSSGMVLFTLQLEPCRAMLCWHKC